VQLSSIIYFQLRSVSAFIQSLSGPIPPIVIIFVV
jgi:hypothetical protein